MTEVVLDPLLGEVELTYTKSKKKDDQITWFCSKITCPKSSYWTGQKVFVAPTTWYPQKLVGTITDIEYEQKTLHGHKMGMVLFHIDHEGSSITRSWTGVLPC